MALSAAVRRGRGLGALLVGGGPETAWGAAWGQAAAAAVRGAQAQHGQLQQKELAPFGAGEVHAALLRRNRNIKGAAFSAELALASLGRTPTHGGHSEVPHRSYLWHAMHAHHSSRPAFVDPKRRIADLKCPSQRATSSTSPRHVRALSTQGSHPEEDEKLREPSLVVKALVGATLAYMTYNALPIMGDSLVRQSVALLRSKDSFLRRSGAYRIRSIATTEDRRKRIVEAGAVALLLKMLDESKDEATAKEALLSLASLGKSECAVEEMKRLEAAASIQNAPLTLANERSNLLRLLGC